MASKIRKLAVGGIAATLGAGLTTYMLLKEDGGHMFVSRIFICYPFSSYALSVFFIILFNCIKGIVG